MMATIPVTLLTGFLGSGKTTLLLSLLPQLKAINPSYKLALLKNEFGDLAVDSQLASSSSISGVREMLNGCICCNLVGSVGPALEELRTSIPDLDRVVIETSGSAFPATLAMEVNRLARETGGQYVLDGVVTVIDVENWQGYEDTSYTAKVQARYTDLIVFNKWEMAGERRFDECLDRLGDLEGVEVAWVKSEKGKVSSDIVFGIDGGLARSLGFEENLTSGNHDHDSDGSQHTHTHDHTSDHQSEVEVLSITLKATDSSAKATIDTKSLEELLKKAPKEEVYRMKSVFSASSHVPGSDNEIPQLEASSSSSSSRYILNWAFGRWTCTLIPAIASEHQSSDGMLLRMTMILARYESTKWKKRIEAGEYIKVSGEKTGVLSVEKIA